MEKKVLKELLKRPGMSEQDWELLLLINHNRQGREFTADEIKKLPLEAVIRLIAEVSALRLKADTDPNSESQFRKEKSEKQSAKSISRQRTGKEHTA